METEGRGLKPCVWVNGSPARLKARWNRRIRSRWEIQTAFPFFSKRILGIALPLSVGVESNCELLDFDLDGDKVANRIVRGKLNDYLLPGIRVIKVYDNGQKIKNLALLDAVVTLEYDDGIPENAVSKLQEFFAQEEILVEKKTKTNGIQDQNIVPMIKALEVVREDDHTILLNVRVCCQNPTLNPMQLHGAIVRHLPELTPSFAKCARLELYDNEGNIFR